MDNCLYCNIRKCHKKLTTTAWVTSCSHIFCEDCTNAEFSKGNGCPACSELLPTKYDVVRVDLQPSEQCKSMVLAGLKPETIMEICTRALSFWTYQACQEKVHLEATVKVLKEKRQLMEQHYVQLNNNAQAEFNNLKSQLSASKKEIDSLKQQLSEVSEKIAEKSRQYQKLQGLYNALRQKMIAVQQFPQKDNSGSGLTCQTPTRLPQQPITGLEPFPRPGLMHTTAGVEGGYSLRSPSCTLRDRTNASPTNNPLRFSRQPPGEFLMTPSVDTGFTYGRMELKSATDRNQSSTATRAEERPSSSRLF